MRRKVRPTKKINNIVISSWLSLFGLIIIFLIQGCALGNNNFYIKNATFLEIEKHRQNLDFLHQNKLLSLEDRLFVIYGHRITKGKGVVLAYRLYSKGPIISIDQAAFEKVTILLPSSFSDDIGEFEIGNGSDVIVFYSVGSSTFPGRSGCYGYAKDGYIKFVTKNSGKINVHIVFQTDLLSPSDRIKDCTPIVFDKTLTLRSKKISELTPWEGTVSKHIMEESHNGH